MAVNAKTQARRLQALDLRLAGASYRQIAQQLGVDVALAYRDVAKMIAEYASEPAGQVRKAEVARLDKLMLAHWSEAIKGDYKATQMVLQIMDRRARLLGLDAPQRIDITGWIREMAQREGLDPDAAVRDAEGILRTAKG